MLSKITSITNAAITNGTFPGAAIIVSINGKIVVAEGYGNLDWAKSSLVTCNTLYDLASLTKVIATVTMAMILEDENKLDIHKTVVSYLDEFNSVEKANITIYHLLVHRSGLEAYASLYKEIRGKNKFLEQINKRPLKYDIDTATIYSDWNMILLQLIIEKITNQDFNSLVEQRIFKPLKMTNTVFNPEKIYLPDFIYEKIAPTEIDSFRGGKIWGQVHDSNAWAMDGISGHAGLFSSANDLAIFSQFMLNKGIYNNVRLIKESTVDRWTASQTSDSSRTIGWESAFSYILNSANGKYFSSASYGHTGFTGTSIWIDPINNKFLIILSNRVNPHRKNEDKIKAFRQSITNIVNS